MPVGNEVQSMFGRIAKRYDRANRLLSGGIDRCWRRRLVREVNKLQPQTIVDLATGSGDVAFALKNKLGSQTAVTGLDFCQPMLDEALRKSPLLLRAGESIRFLQGDILQLPFADESFDVATIAFGFRNLESREQGLREIRRVLRPGGTLLILEFTQPYRWFRGIYYFYLKRILPHLARLATGNRDAYQYLAGSIEAFPSRQQITDLLQQNGFPTVRAIPMTLSIVAIHVATR